MMKKLKLLLLLFAVIIASSCERQPLIYGRWHDLKVVVDWTDFGVPPTGMTLFFYHEDGSNIVAFSSNDVDSTTVRLKEGKYNVLLINLSPAEFGAIGFDKMNSYETAQAYIDKTLSSWYNYNGNSQVAKIPEKFGVARYEWIEVLGLPNEKLEMKPKCKVYTNYVMIRIEGFHNARSVRGAMRDMSGTYSMREDTVTSDKITHLIENWKLVADSLDKTRGYVWGSFKTSGSESIGSNVNPSDVQLDVSFLLVDNKTVENYTFNVGDRIKRYQNQMILTLDIGITHTGGNRPEDNPVILPDVNPIWNNGGGFDVNVDNWGDNIIDIPIP